MNRQSEVGKRQLAVNSQQLSVAEPSAVNDLSFQLKAYASSTYRKLTADG
jgi:hypothetical protein